jgi:hypothetical protein
MRQIAIGIAAVIAFAATASPAYAPPWPEKHVSSPDTTVGPYRFVTTLVRSGSPDDRMLVMTVAVEMDSTWAGQTDGVIIVWGGADEPGRAEFRPVTRTRLTPNWLVFAGAVESTLVERAQFQIDDNGGRQPQHYRMPFAAFLPLAQFR